MDKSIVLIKRVEIPLGLSFYDTDIEVYIENEKMLKSAMFIDEDEMMSFLRAIYQPYKVVGIDGETIITYNCT